MTTRRRTPFRAPGTTAVRASARPTGVPRWVAVGVAAVLVLAGPTGRAHAGAPITAPAPPAVAATTSGRSAVEVPPPSDGMPGAPTPDPPPPAPDGAGVPAPGAGYAWPLLPAPAVAVPFRAPEHVYGPGHRGVDLVGSPGLPVLAARAGTVVFAGPVAGRPVVSVQHDDGLRTTYEPVAPSVVAGARVPAGAVLGVLEPGHAGCPVPACLHWGVRRDRTEYLDPLVLLRPPRVRLLPVPDPWPDR